MNDDGKRTGTRRHTEAEIHLILWDKLRGSQMIKFKDMAVWMSGAKGHTEIHSRTARYTNLQCLRAKENANQSSLTKMWQSPQESPFEKLFSRNVIEYKRKSQHEKLTLALTLILEKNVTDCKESPSEKLLNS